MNELPNEKTEFMQCYVLWPAGAAKLSRADREQNQRTADLGATQRGAARAVWLVDGTIEGRPVSVFDMVDAQGEKVKAP